MISMYGPAILILFFLLFVLVIVLMLVFLRPRDRPEPNLFKLEHSEASPTLSTQAGIDTSSNSSNDQVPSYQLGVFGGLAGGIGTKQLTVVPNSNNGPPAMTLTTGEYSVLPGPEFGQGLQIGLVLHASGSDYPKVMFAIYDYDPSTSLPRLVAPNTTPKALWQSSSPIQITSPVTDFCLDTDLKTPPRHILIQTLSADHATLFASRTITLLPSTDASAKAFNATSVQTLVSPKGATWRLRTLSGAHGGWPSIPFITSGNADVTSIRCVISGEPFDDSPDGGVWGQGQLELIPFSPTVVHCDITSADSFWHWWSGRSSNDIPACAWLSITFKTNQNTIETLDPIPLVLLTG